MKNTNQIQNISVKLAEAMIISKLDEYSNAGLNIEQAYYRLQQDEPRLLSIISDSKIRYIDCWKEMLLRKADKKWYAKITKRRDRFNHFKHGERR